MRQLLLAATFLALPALAQDKPAPPRDAKAEAEAAQDMAEGGAGSFEGDHYEA